MEYGVHELRQCLMSLMHVWYPTLCPTREIRWLIGSSGQLTVEQAIDLVDQAGIGHCPVRFGFDRLVRPIVIYGVAPDDRLWPLFSLTLPLAKKPGVDMQRFLLGWK